MQVVRYQQPNTMTPGHASAATGYTVPVAATSPASLVTHQGRVSWGMPVEALACPCNGEGQMQSKRGGGQMERWEGVRVFFVSYGIAGIATCYSALQRWLSGCNLNGAGRERRCRAPRHAPSRVHEPGAAGDFRRGTHAPYQGLRGDHHAAQEVILLLASFSVCGVRV